jgi:hypothetical protein
VVASPLAALEARMAEEIKSLIAWKVLPATPGFYLWFVDYETPELFSPEPITGWLIEQRATYPGEGRHPGFFWSQQPITASTIGITQAYAIEWPNGKFDFPEEKTFDSLSESNAFLKENKEKEKRASDALAQKVAK